VTDKILGAHEVAKRVESDLWRLHRSLRAALDLDDELVLRAVRTRVESALSGLIRDLDRLREGDREAT
jgi:hypothetical protein